MRAAPRTSRAPSNHKTRSAAPRQAAAPKATEELAALSSSREEQLYGLRATLAAARARGSDIVRAYVAEDLVKRHRDVGTLLGRLASSNTAYHMVSSMELDRIARTVHHEGIVLLLRARPILSANEVLKKLIVTSKRGGAFKPWLRAAQPPLVILHGIRNAHNIGAIVRSAAFFGVKTLFASPGTEREALGLYSAASYRMAEGAMESVDVVPLAHDQASDGTEVEESGEAAGWSRVRADEDNNAETRPTLAGPGEPSAFATIERLRKGGYTVVATSSTGSGRVSLFDVKLQSKLRTAPIALLFGSEALGLPKRLMQEASALVEVPGRGDISSLNVAHSVTAFLTEITRIQGRSF